MLSHKKSLNILKKTNALLEGHFILSSGLQIRASATAGNTQLKSGTFVIANRIYGCRFSSFKIEIRCIVFYSHVLYLIFSYV